MEVRIKMNSFEGLVDTRSMRLECVPARGRFGMGRFESDAQLCVSDGFNYAIAGIRIGSVEGSNTLCAEIVRRFNEFPEELKR